MPALNTVSDVLWPHHRWRDSVESWYQKDSRHSSRKRKSRMAGHILRLPKDWPAKTAILWIPSEGREWPKMENIPEGSGTCWYHLGWMCFRSCWRHLAAVLCAKSQLTFSGPRVGPFGPTVTGIGLGTIYGYVKEIMIIIIASQDGIVR